MTFIKRYGWLVVLAIGLTHAGLDITTPWFWLISVTLAAISTFFIVPPKKEKVIEVPPPKVVHYVAKQSDVKVIDNSYKVRSFVSYRPTFGGTMEYSHKLLKA